MSSTIIALIFGILNASVSNFVHTNFTQAFSHELVGFVWGLVTMHVLWGKNDA